MSSKVFSYPVNPYSITPVADALKFIAAGANVSVATVTAYITTNQNAAVAWNDPCTVLGAGTGLWQFRIIYREYVTGQNEPNDYIAFSGGNASSSVGGVPAAAVPSFTTPVAFAMLGGKMNFGSGSGSTSGSIAGNMALFDHKVMATHPSTVLADLISAAGTFNSSGGNIYRYYTDPQTALGVGTGLWFAKLYIWSPNYVAQNIYRTGGCALSSVGGDPATPPPPSFTGWTQINSIWQL